MTHPSAPRAVAASAAALAAGLVTAQIQCSNDEGMEGGGWTVGVLLLLAGTVTATLLAQRRWGLWVFVALGPTWISLVDCVANDPTSDGLEVLYDLKFVRCHDARPTPRRVAVPC